jgi:hypothetical protein
MKSYGKTRSDALAWNSQALSDRPSKLGATAIEYDLNLIKISFFSQAPNILAIQALNSEIGAPDFLCYVEMETLHIGESTSEWRYFLTPTPGIPNGQGRKIGPDISAISSAPPSSKPAGGRRPYVIRARVRKTQTDIALSNLPGEPSWRCENHRYV